MTKPVHVLIIEDSDDDAILLIEQLRRGGFHPVSTCVSTAGALELALKTGEFDVIISDYTLPSFGAPEALRLARSLAPDTPFIVVSGAVQESTIVDAMRGGARDYVMKENLTRLPLVIHRELDESAERKRRRGFDEQLRHTQRLESVGLLAGGIAHDFNNLLTGVLGNTTLVLETMAETSPHRAPLERVVKAAEQAAHLTRQLLAYAGKGVVVIEPVNLDDVIRGTLPLLHLSVPRSTELRLSMQEPIPRVRADRGQLQQLIINLVTNGAEAIGPDRRGVITLGTGLEMLTADDLAKANVRDSTAAPGVYVCLEIRDNGCGMDVSTQARIFDPFFTTRFVGRGLGLSAVMGIVRSHGGALRVVSSPKVGSTFTLYLPVAEQETIPTTKPARRPARPQVLVIDDERTVRQTCRAILERSGYEVLLAENGREGVEMFSAFANQISLILLDLTMPIMAGDRTLDEIRSISADVPVIVMTGYSETEAVERFTGKGPAGFVKKPFTRPQLQQAIEQALGVRSSEPVPAQ
jgi:signal transduction histidine kinase